MIPVLFSYGSNLDTEQMRARCPRAAPLTSATLEGFRLVFGGHSERWGGAVATLRPDKGGRVQGVLYRVPPRDLDRLDAVEGHPRFYHRAATWVRDARGRKRRVQLYVLPNIGQAQRPAARYFKVILAAYHELGFDTRALFAAAHERGIA